MELSHRCQFRGRPRILWGDPEFAANLKHEIAHTKLTAPEASPSVGGCPPPRPIKGAFGPPATGGNRVSDRGVAPSAMKPDGVSHVGEV